MACDPATLRYAKSQLREDEGFASARGQFTSALTGLRQSPTSLSAARAGVGLGRLALAQARLRWNRRRLSSSGKRSLSGVVFSIENQGTERTAMRRLGQAVGQSLGDIVKGRDSAPDGVQADTTTADIIALLPEARRREAASLIAEVSRHEPDAPGRLAHLVLMCAQDRADDSAVLLNTLAVAERHAVLQSASLFLNLGHLLIAKDMAEPAMRAYLRSATLTPNNKWHAGQRLLDYVVQQKPEAAVLGLICDALDGSAELDVPDLHSAIIRRGVELEDFDHARLHGSGARERLAAVGGYRPFPAPRRQSSGCHPRLRCRHGSLARRDQTAYAIGSDAVPRWQVCRGRARMGVDGVHAVEYAGTLGSAGQERALSRRLLVRGDRARGLPRHVH